MSYEQKKQCSIIHDPIISVIIVVLSMSVSAWSVQKVASKQPNKKNLPSGFVPVDDSGIHLSGWPLEIRCLKDDSIMVFVPSGEFDSGLTTEEIEQLARIMSEYDYSPPRQVGNGKPLGPEEKPRSLKEERLEILKQIEPGKMLTTEDLKNIDELTLEQQWAILLVAAIEKEGKEIPSEDLELWRAENKSLGTLLTMLLEEYTIELKEFMEKFNLSINDIIECIEVVSRKEAAEPSKSWLEETIGNLTNWVRPHKRIQVGAFYIDKYEVTNRQYRLFMAETKNEKHRPGITFGFYDWRWQYDLWEDKKRSQDDQPVTCISAESATAYSKWVGKSLPTPIQWERVAVGDGGRIFPRGSDFKPSYCRWNWEILCYKETEEQKEQESNYKIEILRALLELPKTIKDIRRTFWPVPSAVGKHPHDVSPFGCHDMAGNVSEWVQDGDRYALMGGNSSSYSPRYLAPAINVPYQIKSRFQGFRTILQLDGSQ